MPKAISTPSTEKSDFKVKLVLDAKNYMGMTASYFSKVYYYLSVFQYLTKMMVFTTNYLYS